MGWVGLPPNRAVTVRTLPHQSTGLVANYHSDNRDDAQYEKGQTELGNDLLCAGQAAEEKASLGTAEVLFPLLHFGTCRPDREVACVLAFDEGLFGWW